MNKPNYPLKIPGRDMKSCKIMQAQYKTTQAQIFIRFHFII